MKSLQLAFAVDPKPDGSLLEYRLFNTRGHSQMVQGNAAVEQNFVKVLLTNPGSNFFDATQGGGIILLAGLAVDDREFQSRKVEIAQCILRAEEQIRTSQAGLTLPTSERLTQAEILEISFNQDESTWTVRIALHMEDGNVLRVLLGH